MIWHSAAEFFAMGGYGPYVWGSVLSCALALVIEIVGLRARRSAALGALRRRGVVDRLELQELQERLA